jgi:hypothetical protein
MGGPISPYPLCHSTVFELQQQLPICRIFDGDMKENWRFGVEMLRRQRLGIQELK